MKVKELLIILLIIVLIFLPVLIKNIKKDDSEGGIENEDYYIEKRDEFGDAEEEYNNKLNEYIENSFSNEEKAKLQEYNQKMTNEAEKGNSERESEILNERRDYINQISEIRFTDEQKKTLQDLQDKMDELEPIVDEYGEKLYEKQEKEFWEGRETLADGTVVNEREDVVNEKECDGLLFTNIALRYDPNTKKSYFGANVKNVSGKQSDKKTVSIKLTGDVEAVFPLNIEGLWENESYDFEIEIGDDVSMAKTLDIIPYNEADYQNQGM